MIENVSTQLTVFHCFAHCLLPGRAFASLYALLFLEKEAEIGGRVSVAHQEGVQVHVVKFIGGNISMLQNSYFHGIFKKANPPPPPHTHTHIYTHEPPFPEILDPPLDMGPNCLQRLSADDKESFTEVVNQLFIYLFTISIFGKKISNLIDL